MSSFLCSPKHFNSVEQSINQLTYSSNNGFYFPYSIRNIYPKIYNKRDHSFDAIEAEVKTVMDTIRELSAVCVTLQYKHHYKGVLDTEIKEETEYLLNNRKEHDLLSPVALYKAICCISYQIEIEHLKELRELTQAEQNAIIFIKEMEDALCAHIVSKLPEYDTAKWSI
jgi:FtsZ-binding cell division protein ZapB